MAAKKEGVRFVLDRKELSQREANEHPIQAAGYDERNPNVVQVYRDQDSFLQWAKASEYADRIMHVLQETERAKRFEEEDNIEALMRQRMHTVRLTEDLLDFADLMDLGVGTEEFIHRAIDRNNGLGEPILASSVIYRHSDYGGSWKAIVAGVPYPDFRWIGFNDRASSAYVGGVLLLCQKTWYKGKQLWLLGFPIMGYPNFSKFGFNDIASSAYNW